MNPYTVWIYGKGPQISHRNAHFNFGSGVWELLVHSLIVDETETPTEKTPALFILSSNLVRHIECQNKTESPLHIVGHSRNHNYKTYRFTGPTNFVVTNKEDLITFTIKTEEGRIQPQRKFGIHLSLVRIS